MSKPSDIQVIGASLHLLPVQTRLAFRVGSETLTSVTCARVRLKVADKDGRTAEGWGEMPLGVHCAWPGTLAYEARQSMMKAFCVRLAEAWSQFSAMGHPLELGLDFQEQVLTELWRGTNQACGENGEPMPLMAALVCDAAFDLALHDAFGNLHHKPIYELYGPDWMNHDLSAHLTPASESVSFKGKFPSDYLAAHPPLQLRAWHTVGLTDVLARSDMTDGPSHDEQPVMLSDWIERDGLKCLKVCLGGANEALDYERLVKVAKIASDHGVDWLSVDFNGLVNDPGYVTRILDRLRDEQPRFYGMVLYIEQPLPGDLERHPIDMRSVSARKPLFLDESAYDWKLVQKGRELGWTGVSLNICHTQTSALLSACWARAHGMTLMVQDPNAAMLSHIAHIQLAAWVGTIMGAESNGMPLYGEASLAEAEVHPGMYTRKGGMVDRSTVSGGGFGYRLNEMHRPLPPAVAEFSREPRRSAFQPTIALLRKARRP